MKSNRDMQPKRIPRKAEDIELTLTTASSEKSAIAADSVDETKRDLAAAAADDAEETVDLFKEEDIGNMRRSTSLRSRVRTSSGGAGAQQQGSGRVRPISLNRDRSYVNVLTRVTNLEPTAPIIGRRQSIVAAAEQSSPTPGFNF